MRLFIEKSVNADSMNLLLAGDVTTYVSEIPVASCDNRVQFATSEKGKYENFKMMQGILLYLCSYLLREVMVKGLSDNHVRTMTAEPRDEFEDNFSF